jgi:hypothetical protein
MAQDRERQIQEARRFFSENPVESFRPHITVPPRGNQPTEVYDGVRWIPLDDRARRLIVPGKPLAPGEMKALAARNQLRELDRSNETMTGPPPGEVSPDRLNTGAMSQFNRGLVSGLVLGEPASRRLLTEGAQYLNIPVADTEPEGWHERGSRYAGMAAGAVPGLYSIAKTPAIAALARTRPVVGTLLSMLTKPFEQRGRKAAAALALEMGAGYGAGVGEEIGGPIGSVIGAAAPGAAAPLVGMFPTATALRIARRESGRLRDLASRAVAPEVSAPQVAPGGRTPAPADPSEWGLVESTGMIQPLKDIPTTGEPGRQGSAVERLADLAESELGGVVRPAVTPGGTFDITSLPGQQIQRVMHQQIGRPDSEQVRHILQNLDETTPLDVARRAVAPEGVETVAQRTRNPLLIDIERRAIARKGRTPSEEWDARQRQEQRELVQLAEAKVGGTVEDARLQSGQALEEASGALAEPVEQLSRTAIATKLSDNLVQSKRNAKLEESRIWTEAENATGNVKFPTGPLMREWTNTLSRVEKAKTQNIPPVIFRLIPEDALTPEARQLRLAFGETSQDPLPEWPRASALSAKEESAFEIQGAISALREVVRLNPGTNTARISKILADSADNHLEAQLKRLPANAYKVLQNARSVTRNLHRSFDQNPKIAKLTQGAEGREELAINPELAFEKLGFSTGPGMVTSTSANTLRQVLDAAAYGRPAALPDVSGRSINQDAIDSVNDFLMQRFLEKTSGGENFTQIRQWRRAHRDLWNGTRFPELQKLSDSLMSIEKLAQRAEAVEALEGNVKKVLEAQNPENVFTSIGKMRPRGPASLSPESDRTLWRTALLRGVMRDEKTGEILVQTGSQMGAGSSLLSALDNPRTAPVFRRLFSQDEIENLRAIGQGMEVRDRSIIYDPRTGRVMPGASDYVNLDEGDLTTQAVTGGIQRVSRLLGAGISQLPPFNLIRGGASLTVAGTTASTGQKAVQTFMTRNQEAAIQEIIKSKQNVRDVLTKKGELDKPTMGRLRKMFKKLWGFIDYPDIREVVPDAMRQGFIPLAKTQLDKEDPRRPIRYSPK